MKKCIDKEKCVGRITIYLNDPKKRINTKTGHKWLDHKVIYACVKGDDYYQCDAK